MKYGFIGAGNMGGALCEAITKKVGKENSMVYDKSKEKMDKIVSNCGCGAGNFETIFSECDFVFLGVKPQSLEELIGEIKPYFNDKTIFVSMLAGVKIDTITKLLNKNVPIIRIMPNTPVGAGEGLVLCSKNELVKDSEMKEFTSSLEFAGKFDVIDESLIDAGCALSGCGPAFVYLFIKALQKGGINSGLDSDKALFYATQTVLGAASLLLKTKENPQKLCDNVCSKGGSTIEGVKVLLEENLEGIIEKTVKASFDRTKELGNNK